MAKSVKLKVFRTSIGFHDAYVAVPSQKAALEAWGADKNLFAMKAAEQVSDPKLMAAALKSPGEVIRVAKGTTADHLRAAGRSTKTKSTSPKEPGETKKVAARQSKPRPRPSRKALDQAERALSEFELDADAKMSDLKQREKALKQERVELEASIAKRRDGLEQRVKGARSKYGAKLAEWEG